MQRRTRRLRCTLIVAILVVVAAGAGALGLEAITLGFVEAWTGNGYVPRPNDPDSEYDFDVTGSERSPIDPFARAGARIGLLNGFISEGAVLALAPALEIGWRRYVLFDSGRVAPAQIETATGAEGYVLGIGSARVLTFRLPLPVSYDHRFAGGNAVYMTLSPTFVFRIPLGQVELRDEEADLSGMYDFFYGRARFLMPELGLGYRFLLSDYLETSVHLTYGVSLLDLFDTDLPWYDQTRLAIGIDLGVKPPLAGLGRNREAEQELPEGVEPFPEEEAAGR